MKTLWNAFGALRSFLRGFVGSMELGANPRATLCEHGERRDRCC
jgi:hypothetical protein